jgi:hypothetical protein
LAQTHEFRFGSAVLFLDSEKSVMEGDLRKHKGNRSVTLFVKDPGDMFVAKGGSLQAVQARAKRVCKEDLLGQTTAVVHLKSITLYDSYIINYDRAIDVATDFASAFHERHAQLQAAAEQSLAGPKQKPRYDNRPMTHH